MEVLESFMSIAIMKEALHELNRMLFMQTINSEIVESQLTKMRLVPAMDNEQNRQYLTQAKIQLDATLKDLEAKRDLVCEKLVAAMEEENESLKAD